MEPEYVSLFISQIALWTVLLGNFARQKKQKALLEIIQKRKTGGNTEMKDLAKKYLGETCVLYSFDGNTHKGIIKEVTDGAILLQKGQKQEVLNLDFITRMKVVEQKV